MADTRTDPGEFYPGGKVIGKAGTSGEQGAPVAWGDVTGKPDFTDTAKVADRYTLKDVKDKVNAILDVFKNAAKSATEE